MYKNLKGILNGKKMTGKELGRLILLNNVEEIKSYKEGNHKTLFKQEELDGALKDLDSYNLEVYNSYVGLLRTVTTYFNIGQAQLQQLYHYIFRCCFIINTLKDDLERIAEVKTSPLIITQEGYNKRYNECLTEALEQEESYIDAFIKATSYYTNKLEKEPEADNPLTELLEKYEKEPIENKELEELYIRDNFSYYSSGDTENYFTLTDNRKSKEVNIKEYMEDFLSRPVFKTLPQEDKEAIKEIHIEELYSKIDKDINTPIRAHEVGLFVECLTEYLKAEDLNELADEAKEEQIKSLIVSDAEQPTRADLVRYNGFLISPYEDDKDNIEVFKAYLKELPELEEIINKDFKKQKCFSAFEGLKPKDYAKPLVSWKTLYEKDIYDYKKTAEGRFTIEEPRAGHGIAIAKEDTFTDYAKENYFKEGVFNNVITDEEYLDLDGIERITRTLFINAISSILALDNFLKDVEDIYNIEGLYKAYSPDLEDIKTYIQSLKILIGFCRDDAISAYGYDTAPANKLGKQLGWFKAQLNFNKYKPTADAVENARAYISDIKHFKGAGQSMKYLELYMTERFKGIINEE